jgi:hypothetical protein
MKFNFAEPTWHMEVNAFFKRIYLSALQKLKFSLCITGVIFMGFSNQVVRTCRHADFH